MGNGRELSTGPSISGGDCKRLNVSERLYAEQKVLQDRLVEINKTITLIESQPEVLEVINKLSSMNMMF